MRSRCRGCLLQCPSRSILRRVICTSLAVLSYSTPQLWARHAWSASLLWCVIFCSRPHLHHLPLPNNAAAWAGCHRQPHTRVRMFILHSSFPPALLCTRPSHASLLLLCAPSSPPLPAAAPNCRTYALSASAASSGSPTPSRCVAAQAHLHCAMQCGFRLLPPCTCSLSLHARCSCMHDEDMLAFCFTTCVYFYLVVAP
jgi:hypothetical protein